MFERLNDSKLNVIYGTVGSGKTMAISLLLSELLMQKYNNIILISENRNEQYKLKLYKVYEYLHRYKSLFRKNIKERLDFVSGEKTEKGMEYIEYLENIKFVNIFDINKKDISLMSNKFEYVFVDSIDLIVPDFNYYDEFLKDIKSKLFITKQVRTPSINNPESIYSLPLELLNRASMVFETKVENKNLNMVCYKNRFTGSSLDRFILPLSNVLY